MRPADPYAGGSDSRAPHGRLLSPPSLPLPLLPGPGRPAFHEGVGTRGPRVGTRHTSVPYSDLGALPSRNEGGGSLFRSPRHRILGGGAWQPPGECPRRAPKPAPPLPRDSLPLLLRRREAGALDPNGGKSPERQGGGRGAGAGSRLPFLAQ